jgi:hypothetical protein
LDRTRIGRARHSVRAMGYFCLAFSSILNWQAQRLLYNSA